MKSFYRKNSVLLITLAIVLLFLILAGRGMGAKDFLITTLRGFSVGSVTFLVAAGFSLVFWLAGRAEPGSGYPLHDRRLHRLDCLRTPRHLCGSHYTAGADHLRLYACWRMGSPVQPVQFFRKGQALFAWLLILASVILL